MDYKDDGKTLRGLNAGADDLGDIVALTKRTNQLAPKTMTKGPSRWISATSLFAGQTMCGRYWDRTSDLSGVNGALSR
jgi:hypothetical protein